MNTTPGTRFPVRKLNKGDANAAIAIHIIDKMTSTFAASPEAIYAISGMTATY